MARNDTTYPAPNAHAAHSAHLTDSAPAPCVSLVMPVYNGARFLREAIDSALSQTLENIELVCVDDGSTDDAPAILRAYAEADPRVRVITQQNQGAAAARNAGLAAARGEFIGFLDADDFFGSDDYLETLYTGAKSSRCLAAAGNLSVYRGVGNVQTEFDDPIMDGYAFRGTRTVAYRDYQFDYGFQRFLIARSLIDDTALTFPALTFFEDPPFLVRALLRAETLYTTDKAAYRYRCDFKSTRWSTRAIGDLFAGARLNLALSAEMGLAKLHWYTVRHVDDALYYVDFATDNHLDKQLVEAELAATEALVRHDLLAAVNPADADFTFGLRRQITDLQQKSRLSVLAASAKRRTKRFLAPLYRRIVRR